jgi:thiamine biosynthesis lipoprotein ApbE
VLGCGVLVGLGGDIAVAGDAPPGGWRIRIQDFTSRPDQPPPDPAPRDPAQPDHASLDRSSPRHASPGHASPGHASPGHASPDWAPPDRAPPDRTQSAEAVTPPTVVAIHDGGLATASTAARHGHHDNDVLAHLLDPRAGLPAAPFWRSVSVAASTCVSASAASTVTMIRGRRALEWLAIMGLPARLVSLDGHVHTVAGWPVTP